MDAPTSAKDLFARLTEVEHASLCTREGFDRVAAKIRRRLGNAAVRRDPDLAESLASEGIIQTLEKLDAGTIVIRTQTFESVTTFAATTGMRIHYKRVDRASRRPKHLGGDATQIASCPRVKDGPLERAIASEEKSLLQTALNSAPPLEQSLLRDRFVVGTTLEDCASKHGLQFNKVDRVIRRFYARLARTLSAEEPAVAPVPVSFPCSPEADAGCRLNS